LAINSELSSIVPACTVDSFTFTPGGGALAVAGAELPRLSKRQAIPTPPPINNSAANNNQSHRRGLGGGSNEGWGIFSPKSVSGSGDVIACRENKEQIN
jgi:hypothetical protein